MPRAVQTKQKPRLRRHLSRPFLHPRSYVVSTPVDGRLPAVPACRRRAAAKRVEVKLEVAWNALLCPAFQPSSIQYRDVAGRIAMVTYPGVRPGLTLIAR